MKPTQPRFSVRVGQGVAVSIIGGGVVTPKGLACIGAQTEVQLCGVRPAVFLADLRRPVLALTTAALDAFFDGAEPTLFAPAALVVAPAYAGMFKAHAWNVAQGGILRKVFIDYASAERWCLMRARVHQMAKTAP